MATFEEELIADLTAELKISDVNFNSDLLKTKVKTAIREVKKARRYPESYSEEMIDSDIQKFYSNCRDIALNDYNKVGVDFESNHTENGVTSGYVDRNKLFAGVIPLAVL